MGVSMKTMKRFVFFFIFIVTVSCATLTRQNVIVERDDFLNKLPMLNYEILGEMKYDDPDLDLRTLGISNYPELFVRVDLTEDYKKIVTFIHDHISNEKFVIQQNTFVICLRSEDYILILCDDAATPFVDKVHTGAPIPVIEDFYDVFLSESGRMNKIN